MAFADIGVLKSEYLINANRLTSAVISSNGTLYVGVAFDNEEGGNLYAFSRWNYPLVPYIPGSYANRYFFCCPGNRHLGEDESAIQGTAVYAIGPGIVRKYGPASGYGELVVVIEHDLGTSYNFTNAYAQTVSTRHLLSIYGHLRASPIRGALRLRFKENVTRVLAGDLIGYVNDSSRPDGGKLDPNGDGLEHLHLGIRLSNAASAKLVDPAAWYRGYEGSTEFGRDFAAASDVLTFLTGISPLATQKLELGLSDARGEKVGAKSGVTRRRKLPDR